MKTTIVGYPRIGSLRELKFAEEKYFRKEITAAELEKAAEKLRLENLDVQRQSFPKLAANAAAADKTAISTFVLPEV